MKRDITDFLEDILAYSVKACELADSIDIRTSTARQDIPQLQAVVQKILTDLNTEK